MKKNKLNLTLPKTLLAVSLAFLVLTAVGYEIVDENKSQINKALNIKTTEIIKKDSSEEVDSLYYKTKYKSIKELKKDSSKLCEDAEAEGIVLLKNNNNALPLTKESRNVSLLSISSVDPAYGGTGSGNVDTSTAPTLKEAFERNSLFKVNPVLWNYYSSHPEYKRKFVSTGQGVKGIGYMGEAPWSDVKANTESSFKQYGDAAIVVLSRIGGEGSDMPRGDFAVNKLKTDVAGDNDGNYLHLSPKEKDMLLGLKLEKDAGNIKKIIVLLNGCNQIEADFLEDTQYDIDAALWIGTPGNTGFYAVAEVIAGLSPSGRLNTTFWANHNMNPVNTNFGPKVYEGASDSILADGTFNQDRVYTAYQEGIYVGYKYTETRYMDYVYNRSNVGGYDYSKVVTYPFGYGLSYTNFEYSNFSIKEDMKDNEKVYIVKVDVKNVGNIAGKDVVQVYLEKPYNQYNIENKMETAGVELVGFVKTKELDTNESQTVEIEIKERQFASYDSNNAKTYVLNGGDYYLSIGNGAHEAANNILAKKGYSPSNTNNKMDAIGNKDLVGEKITLEFDNKIYSKSKSTGNEITNRFDDVDFNKYENRGNDYINYLTRNNWEDTVQLDWSKHAVIHWSDSLKTDQKAMGYQTECVVEEDKSEYPKYGQDNGLQLINLRVNEKGEKIPYDDELWDQLLDQLTWEDCTSTISSGMRHSEAIESIGKPECTDHNGPNGLTERYRYGSTSKQGYAYLYNDPDMDSYPTCYPSSNVLAASFNKDLIYEVGAMIGEDALWVGYAGLYGPGSNIIRSPYSGRNFEYFSEDGYLSGEMCAYETAAMESKGLYVYNKHCALNDSEDMRRGISVWCNEQALREVYLRAFELPITIDGTSYNYNGTEVTMKGASGVMTAFNRLGLYWSGQSKSLMTDFLRNECGMTGIAVTDMWYGNVTPYMNFVQMLLAGTNLVDGAVKASTNIDMCRTNHANVAWAMREAMHRILYTTVHSSAMNGITSNTIIKRLTPFYLPLIRGIEIGSGVVLASSIALGLYIIFKNKKEIDLSIL